MWNWRRISSAIGGLVAWIRPLYQLLGILRLYNDPSWAFIFQRVKSGMTVLDLALLLIGVPAFFYAFAPTKWRFWEQRLAENRRKPQVDPVSGWDKRGYHGLFLKNVGDAKAYDVTMEPLQMGKYSIEFIGPEVSQLEPGDTRFLHPNSAPSILLRDFPSGAAIFKMLCNWRKEIGDLEAEAEGRIKYKDRNGVDYETRYAIGADVLKSDGLTVRVVTGS